MQAKTGKDTLRATAVQSRAPCCWKNDERVAPPRTGQVIDPWPVGWPLPLTAIAPSLRWEDVGQFYLACCELDGEQHHPRTPVCRRSYRP